MDKDQKPQSGNEKSTDKKSAPQGGNLVWYLLALGVLLLLMVTMFNSNSAETLGFSDLVKLIEVSGKDTNGKEGPGYIDVPDPTSTQPHQRKRIKDISDIVVGSSSVAAKVTRQRFTSGTAEAAPSQKDSSAVGDKEEKGVDLRVERLPEDQTLPELLRKRNLPWKVAG